MHPTRNAFADYVFFDPGNRCQVRDTSHAPVMWVEQVERGEPTVSCPRGPLVGIRCRWFNEKGDLLRDVFNTKDLVKLTGQALQTALETSRLPQAEGAGRD